MEKLLNEFVITRPIDEAWAVLTDVERIAPCMPGASPEIASQAPGSPKPGTGAFHQSGWRVQTSSRNATSRGQRGQSRGASPGCGR